MPGVKKKKVLMFLLNNLRSASNTLRTASGHCSYVKTNDIMTKLTSSKCYYHTNKQIKTKIRFVH